MFNQIHGLCYNFVEFTVFYSFYWKSIMSSSLPLVSVILPVYNSESFLIKSIESILAQNYSNFEFILINDGSTDNCLSILEFYSNLDSRIKLINRPNQGLINSLNEGIALSNGQYIARMDSDDISYPDRFSKQVELLESSNSDICGCHFITIDENGKKIDANLVPLSPSGFLTSLAISVPFAHGSVMIRKSFLLENNLYYGKGEYRTAEDYALWVNMYQLKAKFCNVDQFLFEYRDYSYSLSKNKSNSLKADAKLLSKFMFRKYKNQIYNAILKQSGQSLSNAERDLLIVCSFYIFLSGHKRKFLLRILKVMPLKNLIVVFLKFLTGRFF